MKSSKTRAILLVLGVVIILVAIVAVVKRDTIADLILRGGDISLTGEDARNSSQARLAVDFLVALRAGDKDAIARLSTAEQVARIQQETQQPTAESQQLRALMLADLPADPAALRERIKTVQTHADRAVVLFETKANSWFVQLTRGNDGWKVSGF
ncbi:MAG: hypothetical protein ACREUW_17590 [Burkholderiales bacterium]